MKKSRYLLAPLAALAVFAVSCSDSKTSETSAKPAETSAPGETTAPTEPVTTDTVDVTEGQDVTIAVITHGDGGVFWSVAQKGAEAAGADLGITVQYQGANKIGRAHV